MNSKIEWMGREIEIPQQFNEPDQLIQSIVSHVGWQLSQGKTYSSNLEIIKDISRELHLRKKDVEHIVKTLGINVEEIIAHSKDEKFSTKPQILNSINLDTIKGRRSIRFFADGAINDFEIQSILEAAIHAPSARNIQPIEYIIITDFGKRKKLAEIARQRQPIDAPLSIVVIGDLTRAGLVGRISPHDVTTKEKGLGMFIYMDAAAAIQNMLLSTHQLGLGGLWISAFDENELMTFLNLPQDHIPLAIICIGKYNQLPVKPPKRSIEEIVHSEVYEDKKHDPRHLNFSHLINFRF